MGAIAAIGSAVIGASSARKAAKAQENAANRDIQFQTETRDLIRNDLAGYRAGGDLGRDAYLYELGLGAAPMIGGEAPGIETITTPGQQQMGRRGGSENGETFSFTGPSTTSFRVGGRDFGTMAEAEAYAQQNLTGGRQYGGFQKSEDYNFRFGEGTNAVNALAGARGGLNSGKTLQDLTRFGQGFASQERNNYLNRLAGLSDTGMNAAAMQGTASSNAAAGVSNALGNIGNAQAAGAIGVGNALQGGISNGLGLFNYQKQLGGGGGTTAGLFSKPWASSGFWG
jgi:hypothetical protein